MQNKNNNHFLKNFKLNNKDIDNTLKFLNKKNTKSKLLSRKKDNIKFIKSIVPIMNKHHKQLENMAEFVSICEVNFEEYYKKKHKGGLDTRRNSYVSSPNEHDSLESSSSNENNSVNSQNDSNDNRIMHECSVCLDDFSIYGNGIQRFICCPNTTACQHGCCVKCWCLIWLNDNVFGNIPNDFIPRNISCPTCRQNVNIRENILNNDEFNSENLQSQQDLDNVSDEFYNDIDLITDVINRNVMQNNFLDRHNVSMRQMRSTVTYREFKRFLRMMAMLLFIHYNVNELLEYIRRYNYTPSIFDIIFNNSGVQYNYRYICVAIISCFCYFIEAIVIANALDNFIFNFRDIDDDDYDPEIIERYANSMTGGTKTKKYKKTKTNKCKKTKKYKKTKTMKSKQKKENIFMKRRITKRKGAGPKKSKRNDRKVKFPEKPITRLSYIREGDTAWDEYADDGTHKRYVYLGNPDKLGAHLDLFKLNEELRQPISETDSPVTTGLKQAFINKYKNDLPPPSPEYYPTPEDYIQVAEMLKSPEKSNDIYSLNDIKIAESILEEERKKIDNKKRKRKGGRMPLRKNSPSPPPPPPPPPPGDESPPPLPIEDIIEPVPADLERNLTIVNQILEQRFENDDERIQSVMAIQQLIPPGSFGSIFVYTNALGFSLNDDIIVDEVFVNVIIRLYDPNRTVTRR